MSVVTRMCVSWMSVLDVMCMCVLDVMDECVLDVMPRQTFYVRQIWNDSYLMISLHLLTDIVAI